MLSFGIELEFLFYFQLPPHGRHVLKTLRHNTVQYHLRPDQEARHPHPIPILPRHFHYESNLNNDYDDPNGEGNSDSNSDDNPEQYANYLYTANEFDDDTDENNPTDDSPTPRGWAADLLRAAIASVPGARVDDLEPPPPGERNSNNNDNIPQELKDMYVYPGPDDPNGGYVPGASEWVVKTDGSVGDHTVAIRGSQGERYHGLGFEVTSPALYDCPAAHEHIRRVVTELVTRFRLRVNLSTGFHVHVGPGSGLGSTEGSSSQNKLPGFDFGLFKRATALLWAADGFLAHIHPPERPLAGYCPPIGLTSRLAHGLRVAQVRMKDENSGQEKIIEREMPLRDLSRVPMAYGQRTALPSSTFPRLSSSSSSSNPVPTLNPSYNQSGNERYLPPHRPIIIHSPRALTRHTTHPFYLSPPAPTFNHIHPDPSLLQKHITPVSGTHHILACSNPAEVAQLFAAPSGWGFYTRGNYNLTHFLGRSPYAGSGTGTGAWSWINTGAHPREERTKTVEFREATGTVSPAWIGTWVGICLGVFRFAGQASRGQFWGVVKRLEEAERGETKYDVVGFLFDLGLFAEGLFVESKLLGGEGEDERFWYPVVLGVRREEGSEYGYDDYDDEEGKYREYGDLESFEAHERDIKGKGKAVDEEFVYRGKVEKDEEEFREEDYDGAYSYDGDGYDEDAREGYRDLGALTTPADPDAHTMRWLADAPEEYEPMGDQELP
ncbi:hypothetical protein B0J18DRAFT_492370 [Chaetomium sp. MPI-SDFR-AT-0129]|nr:hypothetical protein B0J18DRAFT_492370 [Chaetomium sp. MPI-SDFR-AT-0129]